MRVDEAVPRAVVYVLVASRPLPRIDPNKTIKQVVLSAALLPLFNRWVRRWRRWVSFGYWLGVALGTCTLFSPARIGVWLAVVGMPLQLAPSVISVMVMRYDMAVLVVHGYEFWYLTMSNVVVSTLISFSFYDARCLVMVGAAAAFETALLLDANHRASQLVSIATLLGALTNVAYLTCAILGVIEYGRDLELVRYKHRTLYADDVTANLIATLVVLLVHNGVRKFSHTATDRRVVPCISYRCHIAFKLVVDPQPLYGRSPTEEDLRVGKFIPLAYVSDARTFRTDGILLPRALRGMMPAVLARAYTWLLSGLPWVSLLGWLLAMLAKDPMLARVAAFVALGGAGVVVTSYLAFAQRDLLRRLFRTFDFVFLSVQITITHLCIADIVTWADPRAPAVLGSWLWLHWVLLLDAVLPVHKGEQNLRFCPRVASAVLLLFILEQILVSVAVVFLDDPHDPRLDLLDHVIFTLPIRGRVKQLHPSVSPWTPCTVVPNAGTSANPSIDRGGAIFAMDDVARCTGITDVGQ